MEIMMNRFNEEIRGVVLYSERTRMFHFDETKCMQLLIERGKKIYGREFILRKNLVDVYMKVMSYAIEDQKMLASFHINTQKGLFLLGEPHAGKTAIMHLCKIFFSKKHTYQIYNTKKLTCEFAQKGYAALEEVLLLKYPICLDDIGEEKVVKYYGNNCDIIAEVIEIIYAQRHTFKYPMLHITSRLNITQLEQRYGSSFRMMIKELMNPITL